MMILNSIQVLMNMEIEFKNWRKKEQIYGLKVKTF